LIGYIVLLTVVLDDIFRTTSGNVSANDAALAVRRLAKSDRRDKIHQDICDIITEIFASKLPALERDVALEKIIELIWRYCSNPSVSGTR
jgi:hypothetical protein